jgi:putative YphP/YqiW family bacilliredoxin
MYPEEIVIPMKEELTENGFVEMLTASDVENTLKDNGTTLVVINSVCGLSGRNSWTRNLTKLIIKKNHPLIRLKN